MAVALFFGGGLPLPFMGGLLPSWLWFFGKTLAVFIVLIWFRGTLPRFRIDQLLAIAWKFLFPLSLMVIVAAAAWQYLAVDGHNLVGAWAFDGILLLAGYWALTTILFNEFARINQPRSMTHAR
jgi:NADH-quinone oxidoreductase subunit H